MRDPCCRGSHDSVWFVFFFPCLIQAVYDIGDVARRTQDHNTSPIMLSVGSGDDGALVQCALSAT